LSDSGFASAQLMTVLTASVYGAPPVFVWQPFQLTNGVYLRTLQGDLVPYVTLDGQRVFLVASGSSLESQGDRGAEEHCDERYEKNDYWKEQQEPEEQQQKEMEENGNYESGDNTMTTEYGGNEDSIQKSYKAMTTEIPVLEESQTEDISENHEKTQEDKNVSDSGSGDEEDGKGNSTEESYDVKVESQ
jgi:hypothetical protein